MIGILIGIFGKLEFLGEAEGESSSFHHDDLGKASISSSILPASRTVLQRSDAPITDLRCQLRKLRFFHNFFCPQFCESPKSCSCGAYEFTANADTKMDAHLETYKSSETLRIFSKYDGQ